MLETHVPTSTLGEYVSSHVHFKTSRYGINSFRYTAAKLWNDLPDNIRKASSFGMFRSMIKS